MRLLNALIIVGLLSTANAQLTQESDNIIKDSKTNYLWQDNKAVTTNKLNFKDAMSYCRNLELDGVKGWELPGFLELFSIVNPKLYNPTLSKEFQHIIPGNYWSTKTFGHGTSKEAFVIDFKAGGFNRMKMTDAYLVRCVKKL